MRKQDHAIFEVLRKAFLNWRHHHLYQINHWSSVGEVDERFSKRKCSILVEWETRLYTPGQQRDANLKKKLIKEEENLFGLTRLNDHVTDKQKVKVLLRLLKMIFCFNTLIAHTNNMYYGSVYSASQYEMDPRKLYLKQTASHILALAAAELAKSANLTW